MKKRVIVTSLMLSGCAVGPNYKTPENTVSNVWASKMDTSDAILVKWWEIFEDDLLNKYIVLAKECNNDVLTATSNILQARAMRQMAAASFFPQIGADVNAARLYFSKNGPLFSINEGSENLPFALEIPQRQSLYNAILDASWEIDVFGKTRRSVEAAEAVIGRAIEERNDVLISVMAEIATNYMELRSFQTKSSLIEQNIGLLEQKAFLVHKQFEAGYVSRLDDENSLALLAAERAKLPDVQAHISRNIYTLSILTGALPETLVEELSIAKCLPNVPDSVAVGLRSDLLRRRPDIRKVERELARATANIGVAVASFFPSITLLGGGGFESLSVKNLFSMGSKTWALGGDIHMPIFQGGRLMGNLKAKRAETAAIAHTYQQTILKALEETESAIASYMQDLKTVQERTECKNKYQEILSLSEERYTKGLVNRLHLLDTERQYNASKEALLDSDMKALLDTVFLYKALGGGY